MNKVLHYVKKTLKVVLWIVLSFILLFITITICIQIPPIQKKLLSFATSFVSDKTHTVVSIKHLSLAFPCSIVIDEIYLEDTHRDTLLYVGRVEANLSLTSLLHREIRVSACALTDVNFHMTRLANDSVYNFAFLIKAFASTAPKPKVAAPATKSKWNFSVGSVDLKNIRFHLDDAMGGIKIGVILRQCSLNMDKIDIPTLTFAVNDIKIDGLLTSVLLLNSGPPSTDTTSSTLPIIQVKTLALRNTHFTFGDSVSKLFINAMVTQVNLKDASVDLPKENITLGYLFLAKSNVMLKREQADPSIISQDTSSNASGGSNYTIAVKNALLDDNALAYLVTNVAPEPKTFDVNHLMYAHVGLNASDLYYSKSKLKANIRQMQAIDNNGMDIVKCAVNFTMDDHGIQAQNLQVATTYSAIEADLQMQYSSMSSLSDSIGLLIVGANIRKAVVRNSDITYFVPQIKKQLFFNHATTLSSISGLVYGPLNHLTAKNLLLKTGVGTSIGFDALIVGLPDFQHAYFDIPNGNLATGKTDITLFADTIVPRTIDLPQHIAMAFQFKGKMKNFQAHLSLNSSFGAAQIQAALSANEHFKTTVSLSHFDIGKLIRNTNLLGAISLKAVADGQGLSMDSIKSKLDIAVSQMMIQKYNYHNLNINGNIRGKEFEGNITLNDSNAKFSIEALVQLDSNEQHYKYNLNVEGMDLLKLHLMKEDRRIAFDSRADIYMDSVQGMRGTIAIGKLLLMTNDKSYTLDTLLIASFNELNTKRFEKNNALILFEYTGKASPLALPKTYSNILNHYFPLSDSIKATDAARVQNFSWQLQVHNHPMLKEVFFPQLLAFEPAKISSSYDAPSQTFSLEADINKVVYGTTEINAMQLGVNSDANALTYKISSASVLNSSIKLDHILLEGKAADKTLEANLSSVDDNQNKKLQVHTIITKDSGDYKIHIAPADFYLMNHRWDVAEDNYVMVGKSGLLLHNLFLSKGESAINIASVNDKFRDDLSFEMKRFDLNEISGIVEKDTGLVAGIVDGTVLLKRVKNIYGIIADARITNLSVHEIPIGDLSVKAKNPNAEQFDINIALTGDNNQLTASGSYLPNAKNNALNMKVNIAKLALKSVQAFVPDIISNASGDVAGDFTVGGDLSAPDISGTLTFNDVIVKPRMLNSTLHIAKQSIRMTPDGIHFATFTMKDSNQNVAIIDGSIRMAHFKNFVFDLTATTTDFLLFNTTARDNKVFFGRMILDSKVDVQGPMSLPIVNAHIKLKKGSSFTFAVPEDKLTTDKGEDVVEFEDSIKLNKIMQPDKQQVAQKFALTGFDISSVIEIDKQASLRLLLDPSSTDSLVVKGEAALNFAIDRSGKMSLTGAYNLNEGSYLVSLENVIKRRFTIVSGSNIIWNGDLLGAEVSINATYLVRATPFDLIADQMTNMPAGDQNQYKQRYPFIVLLKLRGALLQPIISFEIQLPPEDKGIVDGAVNAKLIMLNDDPSALNKQVFALLVLGRFIQENPLQSETGSAMSVMRTTVGKFLSTQLNQLSSKLLTGVELNFDIQSYDDYQSGEAQGRTKIDVGVKKQLFKERLSVQVGGAVDVEGPQAKQNNVSDIVSDIVMEYLLTKDGRYKLKAFRHNQYEGAIEGQLIETGIGAVYTRDFSSWKDLFTSPKKTDAVSQK